MFRHKILQGAIALLSAVLIGLSGGSPVGAQGGHGGFGGGHGGFGGGHGGFGGSHSGFGGGISSYTMPFASPGYSGFTLGSGAVPGGYAMPFARPGYGGYGFGLGAGGYGYGYGTYGLTNGRLGVGTAFPFAPGGYQMPYRAMGYSAYLSYPSSPLQPYGYNHPYNSARMFSYGGTTPGFYQSFYAPPSPRNKGELDPKVGHLRVLVPAADTALWVNDKRTRQTGRDRIFVSPTLASGKGFAYDLRARWTGEDGQPVEQTRSITLRAGDQKVVDFTRAPDEARSRAEPPQDNPLPPKGEPGNAPPRNP